MDTYNRILGTTEEPFSKQGYDTVSTSTIAEHANALHFKPKPGLILVFMKRACHKPVRPLADMAQAESGTEGCLRHFIQSRVVHLCVHQAKGKLRGDVDSAVVANPIFDAGIYFFRMADPLRHVPEAGFANNATRYSEVPFSIRPQGVPQHTKEILPNAGNDTIKQYEGQC